MDKDTNAIKTDAAPVASQEGTPVVVPTEIDYKAEYERLEAEKAKLIVDAANYRAGFLKEKNKNKSSNISEEEEDEDTRTRRVFREELANSQLANIAREQQDVISKVLKENNELKKTQLNKAQGTPSAVGSHTEMKAVPDNLIPSGMLENFKKAGKTDKWIESFKKNYRSRLGV